MKIYKNPKPARWEAILKRPTSSFNDIETIVKEVFINIEKNGDEAIRKYTQLYDGIQVANTQVALPDIAKAQNAISQQLKDAIQLAKSNIEKFHKAQKTTTITVKTAPGVTCWQEKRPITKVGLYIPGGTAPLFSTILMLAIPAKIAGCKEIILCTPPDKNGAIHPAILYTAYLCGIDKIYKIGGIQAIAAMTFGTKNIPQVFKIFGPGNQYVTVAKQWATRYGIAIDMPAGPSELLVFADDTAIPSFVASDLLSQAEHGEDSQVILVSTSINLINSVNTQVFKQIQELPRKDIALKALNNACCILLENDEQALQLIDQYAPEHFIVCTKNETFFIDHINNAGSVFIGNYTPESAGDYASGTNHTLPTNGYAKQYSGVHLDSFLKNITFQKISKKGINTIGPAIETMAAAEGLQAHKNAVTIRLQEIAKNK